MTFCFILFLEYSAISPNSTFRVPPHPKRYKFAAGSSGSPSHSHARLVTSPIRLSVKAVSRKSNSKPPKRHAIATRVGAGIFNKEMSESGSLGSKLRYNRELVWTQAGSVRQGDATPECFTKPHQGENMLLYGSRAVGCTGVMKCEHRKGRRQWKQGNKRCLILCRD